MNVIISNKYQNLLSSLDIDIIKSINGEFTVDELTHQFSSFYYNKMIIDITAIKDYTDINVMQSLSVNFDMSKVILLMDDSEEVNSPMYISQLISMGIYNFTTDVNTIKFLIDNPNTYKDVASMQNISGFKKPALNDFAKDDSKGRMGQKIMAIKNITEHAGATTLCYLLKKHLEKTYKVKAVEIDKHDFVYFNDVALSSVSLLDFPKFLDENDGYDIILVDCNDADVDAYCNDSINLIEPGLVQLNKMVRQNNNIFEDLRNDKIILNKSILNETDIKDFEKESSAKIFYNLPYVDDKVYNQKVINEFLVALGFSRVKDGSSSGIFSIFR